MKSRTPFKLVAALALATLTSASVHAQIILVNFQIGAVDDGTSATADLTLTDLTNASPTVVGSGFPLQNPTVTSSASFGATGTLDIDFSGFDTFAFSTWAASAPVNITRTSGEGLGVGPGSDPVGNRRSINGNDALIFTIATLPTLDVGETLQFRVASTFTGQAGLFIYEQTGATAGALLGSAAVDTTSAWFDVDGLNTFALVSDGGGTNGRAVLSTLEFQVIPEPSTCLLLGLGMGTLYLLRRKK